MSIQLSKELFDRLVVVYHSCCHTFEEKECKMSRRLGDAALEDLGLLEFKFNRRIGNENWYRREVTEAGEELINSTDPFKLALVYAHHEMCVPLVCTIGSCGKAQLPIFLVHEHRLIREAAAFCFRASFGSNI